MALVALSLATSSAPDDGLEPIENPYDKVFAEAEREANAARHERHQAKLRKEITVAGALLLLLLAIGAVLFRLRAKIAAKLRSGWARLFVVAWPLWAAWMWVRIDEDVYRWAEDDIFRWVLIALVAPPIGAGAARWIRNGFRSDL